MRKEGGSGRQVFQVALEPQSQVRSGPAGCHLGLKGRRGMPSEQVCSAPAPACSHSRCSLHSARRPSWRRGQAEAGGGCALVSGQRNLAGRRGRRQAGASSPLERAGTHLPMRAVAPGLCPGVLGAAGAPRHPSTDMAVQDLAPCAGRAGLPSASSRAREVSQERMHRLFLGIGI